MTDERTDAVKLNREPIIVTLGGVEYAIRPKPISKSRAWKAKSKVVIDDFEGLMNVDWTKTQDALPVLKDFIYETLDDLIDLVFEWEEDWPKETILDNATEDEMVDAVMGVLQLAFPFLLKLKSLMAETAN